MLNTLTKIIDTTAFTYIYDYSANPLVSLERKECVKYFGALIDSKLILDASYHIFLPKSANH